MTKFLLVTDLDNTLVGDDRALAVLNHHLRQARQQQQMLLVYSTGRSYTSYQSLRATTELLDPDALVTAVGTEIYRDGQQTPDPAWSAQLQQGWDWAHVMATIAHFSDLVPQPDSEQRPYKVSFFLSPTAAEEVLPRLEAALKAQDLDVKLVYSGSKDLDILPRHGDKGEAMQFLRQQFEMPAAQTVACGDSGNDLALFRVGEERGVIVGNAQAELLDWHHRYPCDHRYLAQAEYAAGILEGLQHFQFLP